jgi:hypothetical protein
VRKALAIASVALLAAGCGSDDGSEGGDGDSTGPGPGNALFEARGVGFTFEYPKRLVAQKRPQGKVLGQVSVERGGVLNAIKVRRTADRELGPERYLAEFKRDFERSVGRVERSEETAGELELGVLSFEHSAPLGGKRVRFSSSSYFFAGGGRTWQIECIADTAHRTQIEEACKLALGSIRFKR